MNDQLRFDNASKWKLFDMLGYKVNHPQVKSFHDSNDRVKVAIAPRRGGKSYSAAHDIIPDILIPGGESLRTHWIVGPNYSLAEKEFRIIHEKLVLNRDKLGLPKPKICHTNPKSGSLLIKWGPPWNTVVEGKSGENPDSLLGEAVHTVIYSEGAQLGRGIREKFVEPTLSTTKGREIIPTTPSAHAEWVHELYMKGIEGFEGIGSFQWGIQGNPTYDVSEFEYRKKLLGENNPVFQEQYLGQWVFYGGAVYPTFRENLHVIEPFDIPDSWPRIRGIDFGHRDPFVCLWAAIGPEGEIYFYREYYCREGAPLKHHATMIKELSGNERIKYTVADPSGKQAIEDLAYEGIGCISGNNDFSAGRMRVLEYLLSTPEGVVPYPLQDTPAKESRDRWPRVYYFNTMKETAREHKYYRWKERPERAFAQGEAEKTEGEDHAMDTERYMIMTRPSPFRATLHAPVKSFQGHMNKIRRNRLSTQYIGG